jgi:hypothetical protein
MLSHDKKRVIGGCCKIPTTIALTRQTQKPMQKIVARIGVGLDVVKQNPRCSLQFRQREGAIQPFHQAITLGHGLSNKTSSDLPVLFAKPFHFNGQPFWIGRRKVVEAMNPKFLKHLAPLGTDATHLTEMAIRRSNTTTAFTPTTQGALATIRRQGWWLRPF